MYYILPFHFSGWDSVSPTWQLLLLFYFTSGHQTVFNCFLFLPHSFPAIAHFWYWYFASPFLSNDVHVKADHLSKLPMNEWGRVQDSSSQSLKHWNTEFLSISTMAIVQLRQKPAAIGIEQILCFVTKGAEASQFTTLITFLIMDFSRVSSSLCSLTGKLFFILSLRLT